MYLNNYKYPVVVTDNDYSVIFSNNLFKKLFENTTNLKKLGHKLNFEICPIDSENIDVCSPIYHCISSKENFSARITYSLGNNKNNYYDIYSEKINGYTIISFIDKTSEILLNEKTKICKQELEEIKILKSKVKELSEIKVQAQNQAFKIALINKIAGILNESDNMKTTIQSAVKELSLMFGCFKAYYAEFTNNKFYTYPDQKNEIIFDNEIKKAIKDKEISYGYTIKEHEKSKVQKKSFLRIIVPIYHLRKILGIIVLLSYQKREFNAEKEILEAISPMLGNAIIRTDLYQKNSKNLKNLKKALTELKETQVQLINSEKMASLGQLVAGVAHEINTPIASIKSNNELLSKLLSKIEDEKIKKMCENINEIDKEAIKRISNIVVSLKKFIRLDEANLQQADINNEIDLTLELIKHETKNRIEIERKYGNIPLVKCYPNMLNQVFTNLLINACQAIENTGKITIITEYKDETLIIKIIDNGKGISKTELNKIFTAGYTTKGVGIGTGLGLAISKKIIEKHNGSIKVYSEKGRGSEFVITIECK